MPWVTSDCGRSGDKGDSRRLRERAARRGVTLAEGILYLTVTFSVITFSAQTLVQERNRQEQNLVAGDLRQYLGSTQGYVAARYDRILGQLFNDAPANGGLLAGEITVQDVVDAGYLPTVYVNNQGALHKIYGQDFRILARAVLRGDANNPQATADLSNVQDASGNLDPVLTDRAFDLGAGNDEIDLEVLLVTAGGEAVPPQVGNQIVALTQMPSAGFIDAPQAGGPLRAVGPYGAWQLDVSEFAQAGLLEDAGGKFGALVALSNYGPVTADPADMSEKNAAEVTLDRCAALPTGSAAYEDCLSGNTLYDSIVFNAWDSDGANGVDQFPGIEGVGFIAMSDEGDAPAEISGVRALAMAGDDAEISGVNRLEMKNESRIDQLLGISCTAGGTQTLMADNIIIECPATQLTGTLLASGAAEFAAELTVGGAALFKDGLTVDGTATLPDIQGGDAAFTGAVSVAEDLKAGRLATQEAEIGGLIAAQAAELGGLTVGGTAADRTILMGSDVAGFDGGEDIRVRKPECGPDYEPDILVAPLSFATREDTGSAYDRGTKVGDDWLATALKNDKDSDWPMQRRVNEKAPGQLIGVETDIASKSGIWEVSLTVTRRAWFHEVSVDTEKNPDDARMLIQTMCRKDGVASPVITGTSTTGTTAGWSPLLAELPK